MTGTRLNGYVRGLALAAREAQGAIATADADTRRGLLVARADRLLAGQDAILAANADDLAKAAANGANKATLDRLAQADAARASTQPVAGDDGATPPAATGPVDVPAGVGGE